MAPTQPFPNVTRTFRLDAILRRLTYSCIPLVALVLWFTSSAHAQGGVPLVTVATDQSPLNLSNQFGVPAGSAINQAGDFAFVGNGNNALFLRAAGSSTATRLLQVGDEIHLPALAGRQVLSFLPFVGLNSSKTLFFDALLSTPDGEFQESLLTRDGTNYHIVASTGDIAPAPDSLAYISFIPGSINDEGDVNFAGFLAGKSAITYYIVPFGIPTVRIAASDDPIPAACTWCRATAPGGSLEDFFPGTPASSNILVGG